MKLKAFLRTPDGQALLSFCLLIIGLDGLWFAHARSKSELINVDFRSTSTAREVARLEAGLIEAGFSIAIRDDGSYQVTLPAPPGPGVEPPPT